MNFSIIFEDNFIARFRRNAPHPPPSFTLASFASFMKDWFYCAPSWGLSEYIETKLQTTCFYLIKNFFDKQKKVWN